MLELNLLWTGVLLFTGAAALYDHRTGHIPNRLVWFGLLLGACEQLAASVGRFGPGHLLSSGVVNVVSGVLICGGVPFLLFQFRVLGGGDVKLLGGVGAFLGPTLGLELCFTAFVVAALYLPARLIYAGELLRRMNGWVRRCLQRASPPGRQCPPGAALEPLKLAFAPCVFVAAAILAFTHWSPA